MPATLSVALYGAGMSDPSPHTPPDSTEPDGSPIENPSGSVPVDNFDGITANEINPDLPLIDPTGGEGA